MATVRESAVIRMPKTDGDSLSADAYLLWTAVSRKKPANPTKRFHKGIRGWEYRGNFTDVIYLLWPEFSASGNKDRMKQFRSDLYKYLKSTNNAECTQNYAKGQVIWWVSDAWATRSVVTLIHDTRSAHAQRRENKLTPHEAGEDREPGVVTTSSNNLAVTTSDRVEEHNVMSEMAYEFISEEADGEPITAAEIAALLDIHTTTARGIVAELISAGRLFSRNETKEERTIRFGEPVKASASRLYSHLDPVPPRTKREVVKGYLAAFKKNVPTGEARVSGALEPEVLRVCNTRWQTVAQITERIPRLDQPNCRTVLKRLATKGFIEMSLEPDKKQNRMVYKFRLIGGRQSPTPREAEATVPEVTTSVDLSLVSDIESLIKNYVEKIQSPPNLVIVEELERRIELLTAENAALKAEVAKLNGALAPLRQLLKGD